MIKPFNSHIKFVILLALNQTIQYLFTLFGIRSTNYPQVDIFFILITYQVDIALIL